MKFKINLEMSSKNYVNLWKTKKQKIYKLTNLLNDMKQINVYFDDEEYKNIKNLKNGLSWHDFIMFMYSHCLDSKKKGNFRIININYKGGKNGI